jgi:hypothetical protein
VSAASHNRVRKGRLVGAGLLLLVASLPGILNVLAKDHVSTAEGAWAWLSLLAFLVAVVGLLALAALTVRDLARGS